MNPTVMSVTARALLGRRRLLLLLPMPILLLGLTILLLGFDVPNADWVPILLGDLGMAVLLPLTALVIGSSVLGLEIEDGTITHLLTKPLPRGEIVLSKLAVAWMVTSVATAVPLAVAGAIAGSWQLAAGLFAGAVAGALVYSAVFLAFSVLTRRPVALGLIYIMLWENLLVRFADGAAYLSVQEYAGALTSAVAPGEFQPTAFPALAALILAAALAVAATWTASNRLSAFTLTGETT